MDELMIKENEFQAGVTAAMRRWSALRAAVEGEWGGPESKAIAEDLRANILEKFQISNVKVKSDGFLKLPMEVEELEDAISEYMEAEFSCLLEDESPKQVAMVVVEMFTKCFHGDFQLCRDLVEKARCEEASRSKSPVVVKDMAEDVDAVGGGAEIYAAGSLFGNEEKKNSEKSVPPPRQLGESAEDVNMETDLVDDDGFAPVTTRKSRRSNKGQRPGVNC